MVQHSAVQECTLSLCFHAQHRSVDKIRSQAQQSTMQRVVLYKIAVKYAQHKRLNLQYFGRLSLKTQCENADNDPSRAPKGPNDPFYFQKSTVQLQKCQRRANFHHQPRAGDENATKYSVWATPRERSAKTPKMNILGLKKRSVLQ